MSEPPLKVSAEGVELEPKKIGHRSLDLIIAGAAILISLVSLVVAIKHGWSQERLVAANSWPYLSYGSTNTDPATGEPSILMIIENGGIGPALLHDLKARYDGRPVRNSLEFLQQCCDFAPGADFTRLESEAIATVVPAAEGDKLAPLRTGTALRVIPAGEKVEFMRYDFVQANQSTFQKLDAKRNRLTFEACYCSALGECFRSDLRTMNPSRVDDCPRPTADSFVG